MATKAFQSRHVQSGWGVPSKKSSGRSFVAQPRREQTKLCPTGSRKPKTYKMTYSEIKGDLFGCPKEFSLAHCVSADLAMGKGIATLFKEKFKGVGNLKDQGVEPGGVALLKSDERYIYYLVTKRRCFHKPTLATLKNSLIAMRSHCISNGVTCLAMPRIGSGLDRLDWDQVKDLIHEVFGDQEMIITVYYL